VYAPERAWVGRKGLNLTRRTLPLREPLAIGDCTFEAFPVVHSVRAPAVGYRVTTPVGSFFYVPDVVRIEDEREALSGIGLYIGDGSTLRRPILRFQEDSPVGHTSIAEQIEWCSHCGVRRAIFTHCGSQIVRGDERRLGPELRRLGRERGV
jgi:phosphoribosyl 1,2-cyclic phosphodiesterase